MERRWMYGKRHTLEFFKGVEEFSRQATEHKRRMGDDKIYCPCRDCSNTQMFSDIEIIQEHLFRHGFRQAYHVWLWHGEKVVSRTSSSLNYIQQDETDESGPQTCESKVGDEDNMDEITSRVRVLPNVQSNNRGKGPSKGVQVKEPMFLEYDDLGQPVGEWEHEYGKQLGACALKININVKQYQSVPEDDKQAFWNETKAMFHIEDGPKQEKERLFHSDVARRFRDFKAMLVSRWISKTRKPPKKSAHLMPWEVYKGFITKQDWIKFEADRTTEEAKVISEKARKNAKQNTHHHHLGQKSYKRSREQWMRDGRYPMDAEKSPTRIIGKRGLEWLLERVVSGEGETCVIANDDSKKVAKKHEDCVQQQSQGSFVPQQKVDTLCMDLEKKDHSGRVFGVGGLNVSFQKAFNKPDQKGLEFYLDQQSMEKIKANIIASVMEKFGHGLEQISVGIEKYLSSKKRQKSCLKAPQDSNLIQTTKLPSVLKEVVPGNYITKRKDSFDSKSEVSASHVKGPLQQIGEDILLSVGKECRLLHSHMINQPEGCDIRKVQLDADTFHFKKKVETLVTAEDIARLLSGEQLSISVVQVFMMFLYDVFIYTFSLCHFGFLCPKTIAASNVRRNYQATTDYMRDVFLSCIDKGQVGYKLILAPYYEGGHWMLLVINLKYGKVFLFDSSMPNKGRSLTIKDSLDLAYCIYKVQAGERHITKLKWFSIECAQQTGSTESGYYVMRFMYEIVTEYNSCQALETFPKDYPKGNEPYSDEAIDEVREQWSRFFRKKYL